MRKFLKSFTVLTVLFLALFSGRIKIFGQADDFLARRDLYVRAYKEYFSSRQAYLNQKTLQNKEVLTVKLKQFVDARDGLLISYFDRLITKANQLLPSNDIAEASSYLIWLKSHQQKISSAVSLEDLFALSQQLRSEYPKMEKSVYSLLARITVAEQDLVAGRMELLQIKVAEKMADFTGDKEALIRWLEEVSAKLRSRKANYEKVIEELDRVNVFYGGDVSRSWAGAKKRLQATDQSLKEALNFLDEILKRLDPK